METHIPNKNGRIYSPEVLNKFKKMEVKIGSQRIGYINSFMPDKPSDLEPHSCFPDIKVECTPIKAITRKLIANFTLEPEKITFKHKKKSFAIYPKNKKLANKLVRSKLNKWITYLQYEDEGIVQLVKCLIGMKYKESIGNEIQNYFHSQVLQDWKKEAAKQIADDIDKELIKQMLGDNNGKK